MTHTETETLNGMPAADVLAAARRWLALALADHGYYLAACGVLRDRYGLRMTDADVLVKISHLYTGGVAEFVRHEVRASVAQAWRELDVSDHIAHGWGSQSTRQADGTWLDEPGNTAELGDRVATARLVEAIYGTERPEQHAAYLRPLIQRGQHTTAAYAQALREADVWP